MIVRFYLVCKECTVVKGPYFSYGEAEKEMAKATDRCAWLIVPQISIPYPDVES